MLANTIEAFDRYSCNAVTIPINILRLFRCISYQKYNSAVQIHPQPKERAFKITVPKSLIGQKIPLKEAAIDSHYYYEIRP